MYLFALFLVIYEFTAYASNDMIMPGMIEVVNHFGASKYYVAQSVTFYILGNCIFLLIAGFFSERYGKRKTMLAGCFLFLFFSIVIIFSKNIHQFILFRFLQGAGLSIIAIGYALIHENFNDKHAVKLISLMANISILAPLLGPAIGSLIMSFFSWKDIFILTAIVGGISTIGLFFYIPKDKMIASHLSVYELIKQYLSIIKNKEFYLGLLCSVFIVLPLVIWISQAPNLILYKLQLNYTYYVIYQLISIGGLSISSIAMQFIAGKYKMHTIVTISNAIMLLGLLILLMGSEHITVISIGLMISALGMGLVNGCIWRLIMTIKGYSHALIASMLGCVQALLFAIGITLTNKYITYQQFSLWSFSSVSFLSGVIGFVLVIIYISAYRNREWT